MKNIFIITVSIFACSAQFDSVAASAKADKRAAAHKNVSEQQMPYRFTYAQQRVHTFANDIKTQNKDQKEAYADKLIISTVKNQHTNLAATMVKNLQAHNISIKTSTAASLEKFLKEMLSTGKLQQRAERAAAIVALAKIPRTAQEESKEETKSASSKPKNSAVRKKAPSNAAINPFDILAEEE